MISKQKQVKINSNSAGFAHVVGLIILAIVIAGAFYYFKTPFKEAYKNVADEQNLRANKDLSFEQKVWQWRVDQAFAPSDCPQVSAPKYGSLRYDGPLTDSHFHLAPLSDRFPEEGVAAQDQDDQSSFEAKLGGNITIPKMVCSLRQENTVKVFGFFGVFPGGEGEKALLNVAYRAMQDYPDLFVPFIGAPDDNIDGTGFPTVDATTLKRMLNVYPDLFRGWGEVGLYASGGRPDLSPDSPRILEIYPLIREHGLVAYFHPGQGHAESFKKVLAQNPDINFIFHGDTIGGGVEKDVPVIVADILSRHPNAFYTVDELYGDVWLMRPEVSKEEFIAHFNNYEELLAIDVANWKKVIETYPDQLMWGTDRGIVWSYDPYVGQVLANYGRAFIARLEPAVQEKFAHKNAERLIANTQR